MAARKVKVAELRQRQEEIEITAKSEGKDSKKQVTELVNCFGLKIFM